MVPQTRLICPYHRRVNRWYEEYLACPQCHESLSLQAGCSSCGFTVPAASPPDLRPQRPISRTLNVHVGGSPASQLETCRIERPAVTYSGPRALRDSSELFSAVAPWLTPDAKMLDLGCGPRDQAVAAEHYSLRYVGVDYSSPKADLLADAHSIPFADGTFDVVLSYAVLEHLYNPFVAMQEVARVLRPGGAIVAAVSQGEPFHDSYFHHTGFGVLTVLQEARLRPVVLWPSHDTLHSLATMGRYPRVLRLLIEAVHRIGKIGILAPRKFLHWSARERAVDELHRAASICFVAEKPVLLAAGP
jgi:SAM-dependent methyltransferase